MNGLAFHFPGWLRFGGKLVIHGEGSLIGIIANILLKEEGKWHFCGDWYRRCKQSRNKINPPIDGSTNLSKGYSMKATMLNGVLPQHVLYSPKPGTLCTSNIPGFGSKIVSAKRTAIAAANVGAGILAFVGDVNLEEDTLPIFAEL